jgi:addiction module HigA family antidote
LTFADHVSPTSVAQETTDKSLRIASFVKRILNRLFQDDPTTAIMEPSGLTVTAAANALQVSRPALSSLLNSKAALSGDMALRIEKAFGVPMETLMRMQSAYDIAQTRKREGLIQVQRLTLAG